MFRCVRENVFVLPSDKMSSPSTKNLQCVSETFDQSEDKEDWDNGHKSFTQ